MIILWVLWTIVYWRLARIQTPKLNIRRLITRRIIIGDLYWRTTGLGCTRLVLLQWPPKQAEEGEVQRCRVLEGVRHMIRHRLE